MNELRPAFWWRDFSAALNWPSSVRFRVNSMDWSAIGGPNEASITVYGDELDLWELLAWLRCGVEITDEHADAVWWGMVNEVRIRVDAVEVGATLDSMQNAIAVVYSYVTPGSQVVGERKTTVWATDTISIAEYGQKDFLSSQDGMSDAEAVARRDSILASRRWPQAPPTQRRVRYSGAKKSLSATLICKGWWSTLKWRMASVSGKTDTVTTTQISNLVSTYAEFLTGTKIGTASGISSSEYRDGDSDVMTVILALLASGGPSGRRLLATVDRDRVLMVDEEPSSANVPYWMRSDGQIGNNYWANQINEYRPPVGQWIRLQDVIPSSVDVSRLITPELQFVEGATWDEGSGLKLKFRGQPSIEDMGKVVR